MATAETGLTHYLKRSIPGVLKAGVPVLFSLCAAGLALFGFSGGFPDSALIILLRLLRYAASVLALLSLCALCYSIRRLTRQKLKRFALYTALYILSGLFGFALALTCSVIIVISAGS